MGSHPAITATTFPRQGPDRGRRCWVFFQLILDHQLPGRIVREDVEAPFRTILQLDDGRMILGEECQYTFDAPRRTPA